MYIGNGFHSIIQNQMQLSSQNGITLSAGQGEGEGKSHSARHQLRRKQLSQSSFTSSKKKLSEIHENLRQLQQKFTNFENTLKEIKVHDSEPLPIKQLVPALPHSKGNSQQDCKPFRRPRVEKLCSKQNSQTQKIRIDNKIYKCKNIPSSYFENVQALFQISIPRQKDPKRNKQEKPINEKKTMNQPSPAQNRAKLDKISDYNFLNLVSPKNSTAIEPSHLGSCLQPRTNPTHEIPASAISQTRTRQLEQCNRMMNNQTRTNKYCNCCSHDSISVSPSLSPTSRQIKEYSIKRPTGRVYCNKVAEQLRSVGATDPSGNIQCEEQDQIENTQQFDSCRQGKPVNSLDRQDSARTKKLRKGQEDRFVLNSVDRSEKLMGIDFKEAKQRLVQIDEMSFLNQPSNSKQHYQVTRRRPKAKPTKQKSRDDGRRDANNKNSSGQKLLAPFDRQPNQRQNSCPRPNDQLFNDGDFGNRKVSDDQLGNKKNRKFSIAKRRPQTSNFTRVQPRGDENEKATKISTLDLDQSQSQVKASKQCEKEEKVECLIEPAHTFQSKMEATMDVVKVGKSSQETRKLVEVKNRRYAMKKTIEKQDRLSRIQQTLKQELSHEVSGMKVENKKNESLNQPESLLSPERDIHNNKRTVHHSDCNEIDQTKQGDWLVGVEQKKLGIFGKEVVRKKVQLTLEQATLIFCTSSMSEMRVNEGQKKGKLSNLVYLEAAKQQQSEQSKIQAIAEKQIQVSDDLLKWHLTQQASLIKQTQVQSQTKGQAFIKDGSSSKCEDIMPNLVIRQQSNSQSQLQVSSQMKPCAQSVEKTALHHIQIHSQSSSRPKSTAEKKGKNGKQNENLDELQEENKGQLQQLNSQKQQKKQLCHQIKENQNDQQKLFQPSAPGKGTFTIIFSDKFLSQNKQLEYVETQILSIHRNGQKLRVMKYDHLRQSEECGQKSMGAKQQEQISKQQERNDFCRTVQENNTSQPFSSTIKTRTSDGVCTPDVAPIEERRNSNNFQTKVSTLAQIREDQPIASLSRVNATGRSLSQYKNTAALRDDAQVLGRAEKEAEVSQATTQQRKSSSEKCCHPEGEKLVNENKGDEKSQLDLSDRQVSKKDPQSPHILSEQSQSLKRGEDTKLRKASIQNSIPSSVNLVLKYVESEGYFNEDRRSQPFPEKQQQHLNAPSYQNKRTKNSSKLIGYTDSEVLIHPSNQIDTCHFLSESSVRQYQKTTVHQVVSKIPSKTNIESQIQQQSNPSVQGNAETSDYRGKADQKEGKKQGVDISIQCLPLLQDLREPWECAISSSQRTSERILKLEGQVWRGQTSSQPRSRCQMLCTTPQNMLDSKSAGFKVETGQFHAEVEDRRVDEGQINKSVKTVVLNQHTSLEVLQEAPIQKQMMINQLLSITLSSNSREANKEKAQEKRRCLDFQRLFQQKFCLSQPTGAANLLLPMEQDAKIVPLIRLKRTAQQYKKAQEYGERGCGSTQEMETHKMIIEQALGHLCLDLNFLVSRLVNSSKNRVWFHNQQFTQFEAKDRALINNHQVFFDSLFLTCYQHDLNQIRDFRAYLKSLTGCPILRLNQNQWNKLKNISKHRNIFGFAINPHNQVHQILGVESVKEGQECYKSIKLKKQNRKCINIGWQKFIRSYKSPFILGFNPDYFIRSLKIDEHNQTPPEPKYYIVDLLIRLDAEAPQVAEKIHCILSLQSCPTLSPTVTLYEQRQENKYENIGTGDASFVSMNLKYRNYMLVFEKCTRSVLTMCSSHYLELANGRWGSDQSQVISCPTEKLVKCLQL